MLVTKPFLVALSNVLTLSITFSGCSLNSTLAAPQSPTESNFSSPYYPYGYPMNITCGWFITAPENHIVELKLTPTPQELLFVTKDSVEIYDVEGSERSPISLRDSFDAIHDIVYSKSKSLYVLFKSDNKPEWLSIEGISVSYTAIKTGRPIKVFFVV